MSTNPTVAQPGQPTEYVILERIEDQLPDSNPRWAEAGTEQARDATQAIKQHLAGKSEIDSTFVATPARSWKPVSVKTKIALDFGDAS